MKRFVSVVLSLFTCFCLLIATERRALAYVDPGSGLFALQSIASALAAAGYFFRRRIVALFRKKDSGSTGLPAAAKNDVRRAA